MKLINLIKNEYYKLPGKFVIIFLIFAICFLTAFNYSFNTDNEEVNDSDIISQSEIQSTTLAFNNLILNNSSTLEEINTYFELKAKLFIYDYVTKNIDYNRELWKYEYALSMIDSYKEVLISEYNKESDYQTIKEKFDKDFYGIVNNDYKYYLNYLINNYQNEINDNNKLIELFNKYKKDFNSLTEEELVKVQSVSESLLKSENSQDEIKIEAINYKIKYLNKDNTIDELKEDVIDSYEESKINLLTLNSDVNAYKNEYEYQEKYVSVLEEYKKCEEQIISGSFIDSSEPQEYLKNRESFLTVMVLTAIFVFIISYLVGEEFNKGTIKQLLIRPHTRSEILTSKILFLVINIVLLTLLFFVVEYVFYGIVGGFENYSHKILLFNHNTGTYITMEPWKYLLIKNISAIPYYLVVSSFALFLAVFTKNSAVAILVTVILSFGEFIVAMSVLNYNQYFISNKADLTSLLFGGSGLYNGQTLSGSLLYLGLIFILFTSLSYLIFNKMDIKNQ